jgi:general secretion pathway protein B
MSYILDALKKSEQERGRGSAPNVQTLHSSSLNYRPNKTQLWPYMLLAAVLLNLAALFYFMLEKQDTDSVAQLLVPEPAQTATAELPASIQPSTRGSLAPKADPVAQADATVYKPISLPASSGSSTQAVAISLPSENASLAEIPGTIPERDELPANLKQHIPVMEFSAHVYSSNPLQRSIVINGRFLEEGDYLASDLFLSEITPKGAIFDFQGQLFHQGVVSAWN